MVDLSALKVELDAIGANCSEVEEHNTGTFVLVGPWCVYSDGEIRSLGDSFGMGSQWPVLDLIRKHVAPAVGVEPGGDA